MLEPGLNTLHVDVGMVEVEGSVSAGRHPVAATLWFGGRHGEEAVALDTDRQGRFHGFLPREGRWRIDVSPHNVEGFQVLGEREVSAPGDGSPAEVRIELPDTRVAGSVLDDRKNPVPGASVEILNLDELRIEARATTDEKGRFELLGLQAGSYSLEAVDPPRRSAAVPWDLQPGVEPIPIELVLTHPLELSGLVTSSSGPIPGARILVFPQVASLGGVDVSMATSGIDGRFRVRLPRRSLAAKALLTSATLPATLRLIEREALDAESVWLEMPAEGGTLHILSDSVPRSASPFLLFQDGVGISLEAFEKFVPNHFESRGEEGSVLTFPSLAPGNYRLCSVGSGSSGEGKALEKQCTAVALAAGTETWIEKPDSRHR